MPDTQRSLVDLQTLLADNTTAAISPQDIRDFLVSTIRWDDTEWVELTGAGNTALHTHSGFSGSNSVFFAEDYGAVGDGTADDTAEIQACIDAANAAGGGTVLLETSVYKITAALVPKSNVMISGNGYGSVIRQVTNATDGFKVTAAAAVVATNFGIRDLRIQSGHATAGKAINLGSVRGAYLDRIWIEGQTQNAHTWADGIYIYDTSTANFASADIKIGSFQIRDIPATAGSCGIYVNVNQAGALSGGAGINFVNGHLDSDYYIDGTAITAQGDIAVLVEGGWMASLVNVTAIGFKYGLSVTASQNVASYTRFASLAGAPGYLRVSSSWFWNVAAGVTAYKMRGIIAGVTITNTTLGVLGGGGGFAIDIDATHSSDSFNSFYIDECNVNGGIQIANTAGITEDKAGPLVFGPNNNYHGTTSGMAIVGGPHKIRVNGGEFWLCTTGLSTSAVATALNVHVVNARFYGCSTNVSWLNTGAKDNVLFQGNFPASVDMNGGVHGLPNLPTSGVPASPSLGQVYYDTTLGRVRYRKVLANTASTPAWSSLASSDKIVLVDDDITYNSATPRLIEVETGRNITLDFVNTNFGVFRFGGNVIYKQAGNGAGMATFFNHAATYKNDPSVSVNPGPIFAYQDLGTVTFDTATGRTLSQYRTFNSFPTTSVANSGTGTVTELTALYSNLILNTGTTVTTRRGLHFVQPTTLTGTLTTQVGVDIEALSGATNNFGIRNADRSVQTGYARFGAVTAPTNVTDGDVTCLRLNVGNVAFGTGVESVLGGDATLSGFLRVGSNTAPTNVTAGDITGARLLLGADVAMGSGVALQISSPNSTIDFPNVASPGTPASGYQRQSARLKATGVYQSTPIWTDSGGHDSSTVMRAHSVYCRPIMPTTVTITGVAPTAILGYVGMIVLDAPITVHSITYRLTNTPTVLSGSPEIRLALYTESGALITNCNVVHAATSIGTYTIVVTADTYLPAGNYYAFICLDETNGTWGATKPLVGLVTTDSTMDSADDILVGTVVCTTGDAPSPLGTITASANKTPYFKLNGAAT